MKFKDVFIERNFRISNDDPYAKERIAATIILDDGEDEQKAMNLARDKMVQNFKAAYPHVYTHLNFEVVRQVTEVPYYPPPEDTNFKNFRVFTPAGFTVPPEPPNHSETTEKISKGTIEEQIDACKTVQELESFKLIAEMNPKLKGIYAKKYLVLPSESKPKNQKPCIK